MSITTRVLPLANYPNGSFTFGPVSIPDTATRIDFSIQRCTTADSTIWPLSTTFLTMGITQPANGEDRLLCGLDNIAGGIVSSAKGGEASTQSCGAAFFDGVNRTISGFANVSGGPLRTSGIVTIS